MDSCLADAIARFRCFTPYAAMHTQEKSDSVTCVLQGFARGTYCEMHFGVVIGSVTAESLMLGRDT